MLGPDSECFVCRAIVLEKKKKKKKRKEMEDSPENDEKQAV